MPRDRISYPQGIPRWFTYLMHLSRRRRCRRVGHDSGHPDWPLFICRRCGWIKELPPGMQVPE